jgi:hypothetical protein
MRQDFFIDTFAATAPTSRELGLAAVAAALQLRIDELDFDAAGAVQKGAAALFMAGFAPQAAPKRRGRPAHAAAGARRPAINSTRVSRRDSVKTPLAAH